MVLVVGTSNLPLTVVPSANTASTGIAVKSGAFSIFERSNMAKRFP